VVKVKAAEAQRLDHYLLRALNWKSRSRTQEVIRQGRVTVNGEAAKPSRKVRNGDRIIVELSAGTGLPADYGTAPFEVLYEDPWLVGVNKPPGLLVHPVGRHVYDTLINYLHHEYRSRPSPAGGRGSEDGEIVPRLCHRIDRETTGLVLVATDAFLHREIHGQFQRRLVHKEYLALAAGSFPEELGALATPIGEGRNLKECLENAALKESRTVVRVLRRAAEFSLLACVPETGRQNQIRVHLAAAGHPLVGDLRYGWVEPPPGFPDRFLLHARSLVFYHPRLKLPVELTAPLPEDFRQIVEERLLAGERRQAEEGSL
jgi:23S rRNA pseudouridine1911/1915/1917 synthase